MTGPEHDELRDSNPNAGGREGLAGGMGVSSERTGPAGEADDATDATKDTAVTPTEPTARPEQAPGNPEENPEGLEPKAGYPSLDERSRDSKD
jgi:hypothetical protein